MTFSRAVRTCLRKYVTFSGRAARSEYWWFVLFVILGGLVVGLVDMALFGSQLVEIGNGRMAVQSNGPLGGLWGLATLLPMLAAGWRRMHDTGRSGLYLFYPVIVMVGLMTAVTFFGGMGALSAGDMSTLAALVLIPAMIVLMISPLLVLWWLTRPGQPGPNQYGPNPTEVTR